MQKEVIVVTMLFTLLLGCANQEEKNTMENKVLSEESEFPSLEGQIAPQIPAEKGTMVDSRKTSPESPQHREERDFANDQKVFLVLGKEGWTPVGTPPVCPEPLVLSSPVDLAKATSILYPGQMRGNDYKAHGGFRFDTSSNEDITVRAPLNAVVVDGSRYFEQGEVQYLLSFIAPCGIMYRFDHLLTLDAKFAGIAEQFPAAKEGDSRTTPVNPPVSVTAGEIIATAVGFKKNRNVGVDWGVYDLRKKNEKAQDTVWAREHSTLAQHAICWFGLLSREDEARVRSLPAADSVSGAKSDYCK